MTRFISIITLLTFTWATLVQALPFPEFDHNFRTRSTEQHVEGKGLFGKDKDIRTQYYNERSRVGQFNGELNIKTTLGNVVVTNITASDVTIEAINGVVEFKQGVNIEQYSRTEQMQSLLWQSQQSYVEKNQTYAASNITGKVKVISRETIVEVVRGQTVDFMKRIEQDGGVITQTFLDEIHDVQSKKVEGPTAALAAVISLAATLATAGTAGPGVMAAMQAAAMGSLAGQAAVHLVACQGDIGKAAKRLATTETFKSMGIAVLMAGGGGLSPATIMGHVSQQAGRILYQMAVESVINGRADGKGIALSAVANALGAKLSTEIGNLNAHSEIGFLTHNVLHVLNGMGQGLIVGGIDGMGPGALGAFVAVNVARVMMPTDGIAKMDAKERPHYSPEYIQKVQAVTRVFAGMVAVGAGFEARDVGIAIMSGATAVDNNCAKSAAMNWDHEDEKNPVIKELSSQEQEVYDALAHAAAERYQDCVDSGMSHDQAQEQVAMELKQTLENGVKPGVQKTSFGAAIKGLQALEKVGPALLKAGEFATKNLKDILNLARTGINLDQMFKEQSKSSEGAKVGASSQTSSSTGGGAPDPDKEDPEDKKFDGGLFKDLDTGKGIERHHMPADSVTNIPRKDGPAIQMTKVDHAKTSSHGNSKNAQAYREGIK